MMSFIQREFDKLLLTFLALLFTSVVLHVLHHGTADSAAMEWAENGFSAVLGALLGLITGQRMAQRSNDNPPDGASSNGAAKS